MKIPIGFEKVFNTYRVHLKINDETFVVKPCTDSVKCMEFPHCHSLPENIQLDYSSGWNHMQDDCVVFWITPQFGFQSSNLLGDNVLLIKIDWRCLKIYVSYAKAGYGTRCAFLYVVDLNKDYTTSVDTFTKVISSILITSSALISHYKVKSTQ